jgi:hypothetical protein
MFNLKDQLTIIVTASPIPTHPSLMIIEQTLESLKCIDSSNTVDVILAHDDFHPGSSNEVRQSYNEYLSSLTKKYSSNDRFQIIKLQEWGCLAGNILNAIKFVKTPYVLIVQHDFKFTEVIDVENCIIAMNSFSRIKHIRFNRQPNYPYVFDRDPKRRGKHYREETFSHQNLSRDLDLTKTLGWSDNNHLCKTEYYRDVISQLVRNQKTFPEHPCNLASNTILHRLFGTYIYGEIGKKGVIEHLDGRGTQWAEQSINVSLETRETFFDRLLEVRRLNKLRVKVGLERVIYRSIAYWILFKQWFFINHK